MLLKFSPARTKLALRLLTFETSIANLFESLSSVSSFPFVKLVQVIWKFEFSSFF